MKLSPFTILMFVAIFFFTACDTLQKSKKSNVKRPTTENPSGGNDKSGANSDNGDNANNDGSDNNGSADNGSADNGSEIASSSETKMLDEINLLRSNPKGYIQYVEEYLRYFEREGFPSLGSEKRTAQELIVQLQNMTPLPELKFHEDLYKVVKDHGQFLKKRGNIFSESPHKGKNGSSTESRVQRGTDLKIFGENFGSAHVNPRYQLISLLVDAGIPGRGHRVNILDPRWNVAAFYNIGTIGIDPGCWLQAFGYEEGAGTGTTNNNSEPKATLSEVKKLIDRATYMKVDERKMLTEINLLRSNPRGYVKYIEAYKDQVRNGEVLPFVPVDEEIEIADGLIAELKKMEPLSLLKPDLKLYNVALAHGSYLKRKGSPDLNPNPHAGRNGKGAHERIVEGANMSKGGENYQGTFVPIRETVIGLLVDSGIPGYGHRKALLNPAWNHGVCHDFGPVRSSTGINIPYNWLQNFGKR